MEEGVEGGREGDEEREEDTRGGSGEVVKCREHIGVRERAAQSSAQQEGVPR